MNLGNLTAAVLLGFLVSLTIILFPAVVLMYIGITIDGLGVTDALSRGTDLSSKRKRASALFIFLYLGLKYFFSLIPYVGNIMVAIPLTIVTASTTCTSTCGDTKYLPPIKWVNLCFRGLTPMKASNQGISC